MFPELSKKDIDRVSAKIKDHCLTMRALLNYAIMVTLENEQLKKQTIDE
jgi:hypothetical protein